MDLFRDVIVDPRFLGKLALVVVDEAHLVAHWSKSFRTDYAQLNLLRVILGRGVPWFACSATLDPATLRDVIKGIGFDPGIKIQRTPIDRRELLIRLGMIPKNTQYDDSLVFFFFFFFFFRTRGSRFFSVFNTSSLAGVVVSLSLCVCEQHSLCLLAIYAYCITWNIFVSYDT